jgi:hypothetical protein
LRKYSGNENGGLVVNYFLVAGNLEEFEKFEISIEVSYKRISKEDDSAMCYLFELYLRFQDIDSLMSMALVKFQS